MNAKLSKEQIKQRQEEMKAFDNAHRILGEDELASRPIPATFSKLLGGGLLVSVATFIGAFIPLGSGGAFQNASWIGCLVGLWLVDKLILGESDPLDKRRWQHFWHGDLAGYWLCYLILLFTLKDELAAYFAAWGVGFGVGLLNVWRCDAGDKRHVVELFREWQQPRISA
jgi:hypothetical protein